MPIPGCGCARQARSLGSAAWAKRTPSTMRSSSWPRLQDRSTIAVRPRPCWRSSTYKDVKLDDAGTAEPLFALARDVAAAEDKRAVEFQERGDTGGRSKISDRENSHPAERQGRPKRFPRRHVLARLMDLAQRLESCEALAARGIAEEGRRRARGARHRDCTAASKDTVELNLAVASARWPRRLAKPYRAPRSPPKIKPKRTRSSKKYSVSLWEKPGEGALNAVLLELLTHRVWIAHLCLSPFNRQPLGFAGGSFNGRVRRPITFALLCNLCRQPCAKLGAPAIIQAAEEHGQIENVAGEHPAIERHGRPVAVDQAGRAISRSRSETPTRRSSTR